MGTYNENFAEQVEQIRPASRTASDGGHGPIDHIYRSFVEAVKHSDARGIEPLCAENALCLTPDASAVQGPRAIASWFAGFFGSDDELPVRHNISFTVEERGVQNGVVYDRGGYTLSWTDGAIEVPVKSGRFLAVFQRPGEGEQYRLDTLSVLPLVKSIPQQLRAN